MSNVNFVTLNPFNGRIEYAPLNQTQRAFEREEREDPFSNPFSDELRRVTKFVAMPKKEQSPFESPKKEPITYYDGNEKTLSSLKARVLGSHVEYEPIIPIPPEPKKDYYLDLVKPEPVRFEFRDGVHSPIRTPYTLEEFIREKSSSRFDDLFS